MIYIKYFLFLPLDIAMKLIGLLVAPLVSLFVDEDGYLPDWLYWFSTPDSNMFGYLGDRGFYDENKNKTGTYWGRWWVCTLWQWRNTSHGFSVFILGVYDMGKPLVKKWETDSCYLKVVDGVGFDFKGSVKYPGMNYRFRWRFGWKLHQDLNYPAQYVFSISPIMSV